MKLNKKVILKLTILVLSAGAFVFLIQPAEKRVKATQTVSQAFINQVLCLKNGKCEKGTDFKDDFVFNATDTNDKEYVVVLSPAKTPTGFGVKSIIEENEHVDLKARQALDN